MIKERVAEGLPLDDLFVFDVHGHLNKYLLLQLGKPDAKSMIKSMDTVGVNSICVSTMLQLGSDCDMGNNSVKQATLDYPGRIYGYISPNPHYPEYDFTKYFDAAKGIFGIKIHALEQKTSINDSGYIPALEFADKNKLPVLFHTWEAFEVEHVYNIAEKYRNAKIIIAHSGFTGPDAKAMVVKTCKRFDNVFADTAISYTYDGALEWLTDKIGIEKILYGSDMPFFDCRHTFGRIALSKLSENDKIKIFGENAKKIFNI